MSMDKCKKACCLFKFFLSISKNSTWLLRQGVLCLHFQNCKWDYFSFEILLCWWGADCRNCEVTLTDFEKRIHPPRTFPPSTFIDFLDFFRPQLLVYSSYVLVFFKTSHPPRLLILQLLLPLHVYSNLLGY